MLGDILPSLQPLAQVTQTGGIGTPPRRCAWSRGPSGEMVMAEAGKMELLVEFSLNILT